MFPDDPSELAAIVLDATQGQARCEQALALLRAASRQPGGAGRAALNQLARLMSQPLPQPLLTEVAGELGPVIQRLARRVCGGRACAPHLAQELQDEAVSFVLFPERISQYQPTGDFLAWCRRVLTNRLLDLMQRRTATTGTATDEGEVAPVAPERPLRLGPTLDFALPFGDRDLERIEGWVPVNRVLLLCLAGLWRKVPAERWQTWLEQADFVPPFPPAELTDREEVTERLTFLASFLGILPNTLSVRWSRYRALLADLDFIQELHQP
jgi:DNA-directed RNA polymerase specialized sigma24 family protein